MKTLQSNEKLLFESDYFFRTSKFTSLTQKINSITYKSHTTPYGYLCYTHLNVQESFDNVDIAGTSYVSDKSENKIFGPFIQIFENENSDWFNNAINTVYNVYQGNLNISLPIVGDIGGIPYWQNDRYQGEADCKEGSYFFKYLSDDVTDLYKNTDRNKRLIDKTMFSTFGDPAFKTLNEAVAFVPTNTTMEVDYNGGYALSNDANNLFIKIMIEYFDLKGAVKIYWNQAYTCLYLICYGNDGQQAALDRYYQNLNMNQNDCFIAYNVYDYLWGSIDNYKKTHLNFYGDVGYIIKGWYPPGPAQYIPGTIVGWNKRGEKAITFHVD
jgi:hypothetical protein